MRDEPKTRTQVACVVTITSRPLRDNRNYRLYSIAINGNVVREQISAPGPMEVQTVFEKFPHLQIPAEYRGAVNAAPPGRVEVRQYTPSQQQQSQARASLYALLDGALKLPPVVPMIARTCQSCGGTGSIDVGYDMGSNNTSITARCTCCDGTGSVMVPA